MALSDWPLVVCLSLSCWELVALRWCYSRLQVKSTRRERSRVHEPKVDAITAALLFSKSSLLDVNQAEVEPSSRPTQALDLTRQRPRFWLTLSVTVSEFLTQTGTTERRLRVATCHDALLQHTKTIVGRVTRLDMSCWWSVGRATHETTLPIRLLLRMSAPKAPAMRFHCCSLGGCSDA